MEEFKKWLAGEETAIIHIANRLDRIAAIKYVSELTWRAAIEKMILRANEADDSDDFLNWIVKELGDS